jgi:L-asparaginase
MDNQILSPEISNENSSKSVSGMGPRAEQLTLFQNPSTNAVNELNDKKQILIIYTGGTIGMKKIGNSFKPVPNYLAESMSNMTELYNARMPKYTLIEYNPLLDSSDMDHDDWIKIAKDIEKHYYDYDGFVVLHGTDTMGYSASAVSFVLQNLGKTVVYTGATIPISELFSDGRRNIVVSMIVAAFSEVPEVCIFFDTKLLRANRSYKANAWGVAAFSSGMFPPLATLGLQISLNRSITLQQPKGRLKALTNLNRNVAVFRLTPGANVDILRNLLRPPLQGLVMQSYGTGTAQNKGEFISILKEAVDRGVIVVIVTQCVTGTVDMSHYETGEVLSKVGVVSGYDMTTEAAVTKLCYLLGNVGETGIDLNTVKYLMTKNLRGELSRNPRPFYIQNDPKATPFPQEMVSKL